MLCSIDINKSSELEFTLQVLGSDASSIEPRFTIIGPDFAIVCFCTPNDDGVKVDVPKLNGILKPGKYKAKFEIVVGDQFFVPVEDEVELKQSVKVEASVGKSKDKQPKIAVSLKAKEPVKEEVQEPVVDIEPVVQQDEQLDEQTEEQQMEAATNLVDTKDGIASLVDNLFKRSLEHDSEKSSGFALIRKLKK